MKVQLWCSETPRRSGPLCMCGLWFSILNHEEKPPSRPQTWCPHLSLGSKTTKNTNLDSLRPIQESHHGLFLLLQCLSICEPLLNQLVTCLDSTGVMWNRPNTGRTGPLHTTPHRPTVKHGHSVLLRSHRHLFEMTVTDFKTTPVKYSKHVFLGWPIIRP